MKTIFILIILLCYAFSLEAQVSKTIKNSSGKLCSVLTEEEKRTITSLTITGSIDTRDIITTSKMPLLTELDLTQATITAITIPPDTFRANTIGTYGINPNEAESYFSESLTSLKLPLTLKTIGIGALKGCCCLTSVDIPPGVTTIEYSAFWGCSKLTSLDIPSTVTTIDDFAFIACCGLKELEISKSVTRIHKRAFGLCSGMTSLKIPTSVEYIDEFAFTGCTGLTTVILPESLKGMGCGIFKGCTNMTSVYSYNPLPPELGEGAFSEMDTSACKVYVPYGAAALYKAADQWKDFKNIVEMAGLILSDTTATIEASPGSMAMIDLESNVVWTAISDQKWLTVSPAAGNGDEILLLIADANDAAIERISTVTVSSEEAESGTIVVTQQAMFTGVAEMHQNRPLLICYPNPFTDNITIEFLNPKRERMTVDIYNMTGQRVKNLTAENKAEKITLLWDGSNEQGQQVIPGVYHCKADGQTWKVVKGR